MSARPFLSDLRREAPSLLLALGLLILATITFFWQIVFSGAWMPAGGGDLAALLYPSYRFAAQSLKSGVIPLWNPYSWGGAPFAADIQASLFYPLNLLYFLFTSQVTYRGVMWLAMFHVWLAGLGMYLCLKKFLASLTILPPLLGALAYMVSDYFVVHFGNLNLIAQAAWLPFIFLFFHRALSERRPTLAIWAGLFFAVAATAGHIQPMLFIALGLSWVLLYYVALSIAQRDRAYQTYLATFVITLLVGIGLSAFVLIPAYEMVGHTVRAEYNYAQASAYSLAPAQLVGLFVPGFFGRDPALHWGMWDRVEVGYVGVLTLLLALFALLTRRDRHTWLFASLAAFSLLLAMGGYTVLHGWLYGLVPGLGSMRAPARSVFVMDFALAALAAQGLQTLIEGVDEQIRLTLDRLLRVAPWAVGAVALFALPLAYYAVLTSQDKDPVIFARTSAAANGVAFFAGLLLASFLLFYLCRRETLRPTVIGALAVGLLFFDLASLGSNVDVGYDDPTRTFDHPAVIQFLQSDPDLYRIDSRTDVWHVWQPNTSLLNGVFDVGGLVNPLSLADYDRYLNSIPSRSSPLYDFLNAKYVIASKDVVLDWEKFAPVFDGDPAVNVYLNRRALPRALVVHRAIAVPDHQAAFEAIHAPEFDPATTVVVEGGDSLGVTPSGAAVIRFETFDLNTISLSVEISTDAYLVISEVWYPGWRATVDGEPTPVLRANYAFRAVRLTPGQHQVRLAFAPRSWKVGLAVSGLTLLALAGLVVWRSAQPRL